MNTNMQQANQTQDKPLIVLVDTYNLMYRLFHTRPPYLMDGSEQRLEVVIGVLAGIRTMLTGTPVGKASRVIAVSDFGGNSYRHYIHDAYKANRDGMPEELKSQRALIKATIDAIGVPFVEKEEVEADDLIGMLTAYYVSQGFRVMINTTDKDMLQLVSDDVVVFNPMKKAVMRKTEVIDKMGVEPELVASVLALVGDKVDGIDGLDGVGVGKASKLLKDYGSLQGVLLNAHEVKGVLGETLRGGLLKVAQNLSLTTICTNTDMLSDEMIAYASGHGYNQAKCEAIHAKFPVLKLIRE